MKTLPQKNDDVLTYLETRRSNLAKTMIGPGPSPQERDRLLTIAARVPDHRKLAPWRFIIFEGDGRARAGAIVAQAYDRANPDHPDDRRAFEAARFNRAPLVVGVISAPVDCPRGTPKWEQELSAGAVCFALCMAAQASGFASQWLTEWFAYDQRVTSALGVKAGESVAGFIYIGAATQAPTERPRPDLTSRVTAF